MKSRMDKYEADNDFLERSQKNSKLYDEAHPESPSTKVTLLDNVSEIDISKIKEMIDDREGYRRVKNYREALGKETNNVDDEDENYDIYEDIENKIYDINSILAEAKDKRVVNEEKEKMRSLKNTQYNILSRLDLNNTNHITEEDDEDDEDMDKDFFTDEKEFNKLKGSSKKSGEKEDKEDKDTSGDLFEDLKGTQTVLTQPIDHADIEINKIEHEMEEKNNNTFYTGVLNFSKADFEELHDLQSTVKTNNKLIKILMFMFIASLLIIIGLVVLKFI